MIHLQNVSKMSSRVLARGLEDVFARHLEGVLKTSWRRMDRMNIFFLTKTSWRRFEDVFWRRMITKNIFVFIKTSWRRLHQDECLLGIHGKREKNKVINVIKKHHLSLLRVSLSTIYKSFFQPYLDNGDLIYEKLNVVYEKLHNF